MCVIQQGLKGGQGEEGREGEEEKGKEEEEEESLPSLPEMLPREFDRKRTSVALPCAVQDNLLLICTVHTLFPFFLSLFAPERRRRRGRAHIHLSHCRRTRSDHQHQQYRRRSNKHFPGIQGVSQRSRQQLVTAHLS